MALAPRELNTAINAVNHISPRAKAMEDVRLNGNPRLSALSDDKSLAFLDSAIGLA